MKRIALAVAVGTTAFGSIYGLAASLGVTTMSLGSGSATVAACQNSLNVTYAPTFTATGTAGFTATNVVLNAVTAACSGKDAIVTLSGPSAPEEVTVTIPTITGTNTANVNVPFPTVLASEVTGVHVLIAG